jgi:hypothetical protein
MNDANELSLFPGCRFSSVVSRSELQFSRVALLDRAAFCL